MSLISHRASRILSLWLLLATSGVITTLNAAPDDNLLRLKSAIESNAVDVIASLNLSSEQINQRYFSDIYTNTQQAAIHLAAGKNKTLLQTLIDLGADPEQTDSLGNTPLHIAAKNNKPYIIETLISLEVGFNKLNIAGNSAIQIARSAGHYNIVRLLLSAGALDSAVSEARNTNSATKDYFVGKEINYGRSGDQFSGFSLDPTGNRLFVVSQPSNRLTRIDLTTRLPMASEVLDQPCSQIIFHQQKLILVCPNNIQIRHPQSLKIIAEHATHKITAISVHPTQNTLAYSDGWTTYILNLDSGLSKKITTEAPLRQLYYSTSGAVLYLVTDFTIDSLETENYTPQGHFEGFTTSNLVWGENLINLIPGEAGGVAYQQINPTGKIVSNFAIEQSFQQRQVTLQSFNEQAFLAESFNKIILSGLNGHSYQYDFGDTRFSDFIYHKDRGFILFHPDEIKIINRNGTVEMRLLAGERTHQLGIRLLSGNTKLSYQANYGYDFEFIAIKEDIEVHLLDTQTKRPPALKNPRLLKNPNSNAVITAIDANDTLLAAGYADGSYALWRLPELELIKNDNYLNGRISTILLDSTGENLYLGGLGRVASINLLDGKETMFRGHTSYISDLALSVDHRLLVSSAPDGALKFWDIKTSGLIHSLQFSAGWLTDLNLNSDFIINAQGPGIRNFTMNAAELHADLLAPKPSIAVQLSNTNAVGKIVFDQQGLMMANVDGNAINIWDIKTGLLQNRIFPQAGNVNDLVFTTDGLSLVLVTGESVEYWDPLSGQLQKNLDQRMIGGAYHEVNHLPNINMLLASNIHGWHNPYYLHPNSGQRVATLPFSQQSQIAGDNTQDIAISASGKRIAIFGSKAIHVLQLEGRDYQPVISINRNRPDITNNYWKNYIGFSQDERYINYLSFEDKNYTVIYDLQTQTEVFKRRGKLSVFLDQHRFVYMNGNTQLSLVDLDTGEETSINNTGHQQLISTLAYHHQEQIFISVDIWGNTFHWDAITGASIKKQLRFDNDVYVSELSSDGRFIAYTNKQGIHLLDLQQMKHLSIDGNNYPYFGAFTADASKFYYRQGADYHYIDLTSLESVFGFTTAWDNEHTKGSSISTDNQYLSFKNQDEQYIYHLQSGKLLSQFSRRGIAAENSIFSPTIFQPAESTVIGHMVSSEQPGFASLQLAKYNFTSAEITYIAEPVKYDMSNEIQQFSSKSDLARTGLSRSGRYRAYSENSYLKVIDLNNGETLFNSYRNKVEHLLFDDQEQFLILADDTGYIEKISLQNRSVIARYKAIDARITNMKTVADKLLIMGDNEVINLFDLNTDSLIISLAPRGEADFIIMNDSGYYYATKNAAQLGMAFRQGKKIYPFEQFDLQFNRPDQAFKALLARGITDPQLAQSYTQAYKKRLQRFGINADNTTTGATVAPPLLQIDSSNIPVNTDQSSLHISYQATGESLTSLHAWVNNVPVGANHGNRLANKTGTITIPLNNGANKIQLAVRNEAGLESLRQTFNTFSTKNSPVKRQVVIIGASKYQQATHNLDYAAKDATDIKHLFEDENTQVHLLLDEAVTNDNIRSIKDSLLQSQTDDQIILFYAGHGLLTQELDYYLGTHDIDFNNPAAKGLSFSTLEALFDGIPARNRLMLIDACHSGEADKFSLSALDALDTSAGLQINKLTKSRGFDVFEEDEPPKLGLQNSFELSKNLFADIRNDTGISIVSASGSAEFAWEDEQLNNGVFTYSLLKGLLSGKADRNNDLNINVSEIQAYVREQVVELTQGLQQPTFRRENIQNDWTIYARPKNND